jgi:2,3-dihydroxybenzoate-AMP ligase
MPLGLWPGAWARRNPGAVAAVDGEFQLSFAELADRVDILATNLLGSGLSCGDNMVMQLPNCWEFIVLFFACQRIGVAPALALPQHREQELGYIAEHVNARAIAVKDHWRGYDHQALAARVVSRLAEPVPVLVAGEGVTPGNLDLVRLATPPRGTGPDRAILDRIEPDPLDAAFFLLSGGTTGTPKIIARTHDDYGYSVRCSAEACGYDAHTVFLAALPMAHGLTLGGPGVLGALAVGGRVVIAASPNPDTAFPIIAAQRVTTTAVTPAVALRWLEAAAEPTRPDLSSLAMLQVAGAPLPRETARRIEPVLGCRLQQVFGMSEGLHCYTRAGDPLDVVLNTQGRPMSPGDELLIVDAERRPVPVGEVGELLVRGPTTIRGYFADPDADGRSFAPGGWYRTGDLVCQDRRGNLTVKGRTKDVVNRGGEKISAEEVERPLLALPQVAQAAVIPLPDAALGERVCACVVLHPGHRLDIADVRDACIRAGLAPFKAPERLERLPGMPLTAVGKVDKKALRELVLARTATNGRSGEAA